MGRFSHEVRALVSISSGCLWEEGVPGAGWLAADAGLGKALSFAPLDRTEDLFHPLHEDLGSTNLVCVQPALAEPTCPAGMMATYPQFWLMTCKCASCLGDDKT